MGMNFCLFYPTMADMEHGYYDKDEFLEQVPFPETQNYLKKVYKAYWNYARIYGKE